MQEAPSHLRIEVIGRPITQGSKTRTRFALIDSNAAKLAPWREAVKYAALCAKPEGWAGLGAFTLYARFTLPKAKSNKNGQPIGAHSGDIDKLCRAVCDALTDAGIWRDDSQCVALIASKHYALEDALPGCTLLVSRYVSGKVGAII